MMVDDQNLPAAVPSKATNHALAPVGNTDLAMGPAKRIRTGVNRVGQNMILNPAVGWRSTTHGRHSSRVETQRRLKLASV
jgi:hypothetical protein